MDGMKDQEDYRMVDFGFTSFKHIGWHSNKFMKLTQEHQWYSATIQEAWKNSSKPLNE